MEPARSPKKTPEQESLGVLDDIVREATSQLRASPRQPRPSEPYVEEARASGAALSSAHARAASAKFDIEERQRQFARTFRKPTFEFTPSRITALVLALVGAILWLRLLLSGTYGSAPPVDAAYAEASMRWALVLTSKRVDEFRRVYHRAPSTLSEIGRLPTELIGYERISVDRYRLTGPTPNGPLVLDSMGSRDGFLGRSLETLHESSAVKP
jgi:hypothetical protein